MWSTTPPTVAGMPLVGAWKMVGQKMHRAVHEQHERLGDLYRFRLGPTQIWSVRDPAVVEDILVHRREVWQKTRSPTYKILSELLGQGLVTADGPTWLKHRRLAQPAFHKERLARFAAQMAEAAENTAQRFDDAARRGETIDVLREMLLFTQRVIGLTMLSIDLAGERSRALATALEEGLRAVEARTSTILPLPPWIPTASVRTLRRSRAALDELVFAVIAERRALRRAGNAANLNGDLLDMLMDAVDDDTKETLTDVELRDEVMTIFLAGHETTSNLLSWCLVALHDTPAIDQALSSSLTGVSPLSLSRPSTTPTLLDRVIDETLRWRPPVWAVDRAAASKTTLSSYPVAAGDVAIISPWALHHHPRYWPEAERFNPDRFLPEAVAARPRSAFLPFLAGNRKCIGDQFALSEARIALATWLPRFRLSFAHTRQEEELAVTLRPRGPLMAHVERR
jgi:cytochrome P450